MLVYVDENVAEMDLGRALGEVSPARRAYALRYRNELDRKLSVAVYLLLKKGLREGYGLDENPILGIGSNGKPFLVDHPDIHFSFSHCPKAAVCAIASQPVGIDVEAIASIDWDVAERVLSADELKIVRKSSQSEVAFVRYWTMKEALVKLRGEPMDERRLPELLKDADTVRFETRVAQEYVISTASPLKSTRPAESVFRGFR